MLEHLDHVKVNIVKVIEIANTDADYLDKLKGMTNNGKQIMLLGIYFNGDTSALIMRSDAIGGNLRVPIDALTIVKKWNE